MKKTLFTTLAMTLLSGCVVFSIHPIYSVQDLVFEPRLLGAWKEKKDGPPQIDDNEDKKETQSTWLFNRAVSTERVNGENKEVAYYNLNIIEPDEDQSFHDVHMVKIGGEFFVNLRASDEVWEKVTEFCEQNKVEVPLVIPVNFFLWVKFKEDEIRLLEIDDVWLEKRLKANPKEISHTFYENEVLLTAGPSEVQKFIEKHLKTEQAWDEFIVLKQKPLNL